MRTRSSLLLSVTLCSLAWAASAAAEGPELFWRETDRERIKIKVEDGRVTERWTYPITENAPATARLRRLGDVDLTRPVALMVGAELDGISDTGLGLADEVVEIPMSGMVGSLNVSVAAAVLLYESKRQREADPTYRALRLSQDEQNRLAVEWSYPRITAICREQGLPYPDVDEDGYLIPDRGGAALY